MTRACSLLAVGLALAGSVLIAQDKPNFVGTWKLPADAQAEPFTPPQMVVALDGKTMTVVATSQMGEFKTTYNMDETEAKSPIQFNGDTIDRTTKAAWDGNKLVITTKFGENNQTQTWSLDGGVLTVDRTGGRGPSQTKYKKTT